MYHISIIQLGLTVGCASTRYMYIGAALGPLPMLYFNPINIYGPSHGASPWGIFQHNHTKVGPTLGLFQPEHTIMGLTLGFIPT